MDNLIEKLLYDKDGKERDGLWSTCVSCGKRRPNALFSTPGTRIRRLTCRECLPVPEPIVDEPVTVDITEPELFVFADDFHEESAEPLVEEMPEPPAEVEMPEPQIASGEPIAEPVKRARKKRELPPITPGLEKLDSSFVRSLLVIQSGGECSRCQYSEFFHSLQFHHRDPKEKFIDVRHAISLYCTNPSEERRLLLMREIDKCVLLCANCHMSLHAGAWKLQGDENYG